jgi:hypothetical protein
LFVKKLGNFMLSSEELESRMQPGALSQDGFLGKNEKLDDVLTRDAKTVLELGVTYDELADRLEILLQAATESKSRKAKVKNFSVESKVFTGFQICPWTKDIHHAQCTGAGGVKFGSVDWCIKNLNTDQQMCGPGLITHLIRAHHFFEGFGSPRRVDPRELAMLLKIGRFKDK